MEKEQEQSTAELSQNSNSTPNTEQQLTKADQSQNSDNNAAFMEQDENTDEKENDEWKTKLANLEASNKQTQEMVLALTAQQATISEGITAQMEAMTRIAQSLESAAKTAENQPKASTVAQPEEAARPETAKPEAAQDQPKPGRKKARKAGWI